MKFLNKIDEKGRFIELKVISSEGSGQINNPIPTLSYLYKREKERRKNQIGDRKTIGLEEEFPILVIRSQELRDFFEKKKLDYQRRINRLAYVSPESPNHRHLRSAGYKLALTEKLLSDGEINLRKYVPAISGDADGLLKRNACLVIKDYFLTGGKNIVLK